jgi:hypothetical protein
MWSMWWQHTSLLCGCTVYCTPAQWLPDDGSYVNRNMSERPSEFLIVLIFPWFYNCMHHCGTIKVLWHCWCTVQTWRSAQHVRGNLLPIFRIVRLGFFTTYGIVSCCCGRQGFGERKRGTTCTVRTKVFEWNSFFHTVAPRCRTATGHYTICCKKSQSCAPEDGQKLPETCWADLGDHLACFLY